MPKLLQDQSIYFTFNPADVAARVCKHVAFSRNMLRPEACTKKHFEFHVLRKGKKEKACSGIKKNFLLQIWRNFHNLIRKHLQIKKKQSRRTL